MVRGAAIGFVVSMLLTTVATLLMLSGTVHAQQGPRHVFSGAVRNAGDDVYFGKISFLDMSGQEVANVNAAAGRYKISVVEPAGRSYSGQAFQITVTFGDRIYERAQRVNWQAGGVTVLDLDFGAQAGGWRWHQAPSQDRRQEDQQRIEQNNQDRDRRMEMDEQRMKREGEESARRMEMEEQRMEMEQQRMESEDALRREQMKLQSDRQEREGQDRREMEQQRMESEDEDRIRRNEMEQQDRARETERREREGEERREMERQRMEQEAEERKQRLEMERQRMAMDQQRVGRGQPGVRPVAGEKPTGGPGRGLFSNNKAGEATSGIDNIMDPGMLTIIGIVLTVLTTGMTLFKGD
jgi:hypothetical protein